MSIERNKSNDSCDVLETSRLQEIEHVQFSATNPTTEQQVAVAKPAAPAPGIVYQGRPYENDGGPIHCVSENATMLFLE